MKTTYLPPQVIAGTNFNVKRFEELYTWIESIKADAIAVNQKEHGLCCDALGSPGIELMLSGDRLTLSKCIAVTPSGILMHWMPNILEPIELNLSGIDFQNESKMDVILIPNVDGKRIPVGTPDTNEIPYRAPFSTMDCRMELHPCNSTEQYNDTFKIGAVIKEGSNFILEEYLPSCTQCGAHPILWEKVLGYKKDLQTLYSSLMKLIDIIDPAKEDVIVCSVANFSKQLGRYLSPHITTLKQTNIKTSPTEILNIIYGLSEVIEFEWKIIRWRADFEEVLTYNARNSANVFDKKVIMNLNDAINEQLELNDQIKYIDPLFDQFIIPLIALGNQTRIINPQQRKEFNLENNAKPERTSW